MTTYREIFSKFLDDLNNFDKTEPILVTYDQSVNALTYKQLNKVVILNYLSPFFNPGKFKIGVLTEPGLVSLITEVTKLLSNNDLDNLKLVLCMNNLKIDFYKYFSDKRFRGPQKYITLDLVSISNKFVSKLFCRWYSNRTRILWNLSIKDLEYGHKNKR